MKLGRVVGLSWNEQSRGGEECPMCHLQYCFSLRKDTHNRFMS